MDQKTTRESDFEAQNSQQYDFVTDAWKIIFGDSFHIGYFEHGDESYQQATENLIWSLASMGTFSPGLKVLDVGCGVGGPAVMLHEKYGCEVLGITISEKGVREAMAQAKSRGCNAHVKFKVANAQDNQLPAEQFDIVWAMESFHLMDAKPRAFAECYRVLRKGGQLLLCDNMVGRKLSTSELVKYYKDLRLLERVYGKMQHETLAYYEAATKAAGFENVVGRDISSQTHATIPVFRKTINEHYDELVRCSSKQYIDDFLLMCDAHQRFDQLGINAYGLLRAVKQSS